MIFYFKENLREIRMQLKCNIVIYVMKHVMLKVILDIIFVNPINTKQNMALSLKNMNLLKQKLMNKLMYSRILFKLENMNIVILLNIDVYMILNL